MTLTDHVLFRFPKNRELQFAAASVMQNYVNTYDARMEISDVSGGRVKWQLCYDIEIAPDDWKLFQQIDLKISKQPQPIISKDMIVDLREERLAMFADSPKHVVQLYGIQCGVEVSPLPEAREVTYNAAGTWAYLSGVSNHYEGLPNAATVKLNGAVHEFSGTDLSVLALQNGWQAVTGEELAVLKTSPWKGFIGLAGWETYLAATLALPVIEILPIGRRSTLISKFANSCYRVVEQKADVARQIFQAQANLDFVFKRRAIMHGKEVITGGTDVCRL